MNYLLKTKTLHTDARTFSVPAKPIVLRYTAVHLAVGLLVALTAIVCDGLIAQTGGLGDLGKQTLIYTVQTLITLAAQAFLPLWSAGFLCCALGYSRRQNVETRHLLGGLQRWGGLLRLYLMEGFVYLSIAYVLLMGVLTVFIMTPWGAELIAVMYTAVNTTSGQLTPELEEALLAAMQPFYVVWLPIMLALMLFLSYQFRLALYRVLDQEHPGAIRAMLESLILLRRHRWQLVKLDLSWWWYYLLTAVLGGVLYVPEVLTLLGVSVPLDGNILYLMCYLVYALAMGGLYLLCLARVQTSYTLFYDRLANGQWIMDNG